MSFKSIKNNSLKKTIKLTLSLIFLTVFSTALHAQTYPGWFAIYFSNKAASTFSLAHPEDYLSTRALDQRQKNLVIIDSTDLPVNPSYLLQISNIGFVKYSSRWQNSALVRIDDSASLSQIQAFPFVVRTEYLGPFSNKKVKLGKVSNFSKGYEPVFDSFPDYGKTLNQLNIIGLTPIHHNGFLGQGVLIAILDAGFNSADRMKSFSHIFDRNGIAFYRDIILPGNNLFNENTHGTNVLGTMAAVIPNQYFGSSPHADFILLRTEDVGSEFPVEEYYWLVGAEIADSAGAQIITSSLSYTEFDEASLNHNHSMLDGKTTIVSKAASMAVKKGIIVVTSAGNDGNNSWQKIGFPADGIDVVSVGAIDSLGNYASLSSIGYTVDGRVKPDLMGVGKSTALVSNSDRVFYGNGTSFSTPTIAGALATLMGAHPSKTAVQIRQALLLSCNHYLTPDSFMGYGIPNLFVADLILRGVPKPNPNEFAFQVMPNPFSAGFYLITNPSDSQTVEIGLFDLNGKLLFNSIKVLNRGTQALFIGQISELSNGIYFLKLKTNGKTYSKKLIKQQ